MNESINQFKNQQMKMLAHWKLLSKYTKIVKESKAMLCILNRLIQPLQWEDSKRIIGSTKIRFADDRFDGRNRESYRNSQRR